MRDASTRELATARLQLLPISLDDAQDLLKLWTNKEVRRYLWDNRIIPLETVRTIIDDSEAFFAETGSGMFGVRLSGESDEIIGFCGNRPFEGTGEVELLYGIHPDYWSRGIGTEAARAVLSHGIRECGFHRVIAATDTPNQRSVKVLQRLGMFFDRRQKHHGLDTVFYSICAEDFEQQRLHG